MKICITAQDQGTGAPFEQRFGRAPFFVFVDEESGETNSIANSLAGAGGGVGPRAAQLVADTGAGVLITGQVGGNAATALQSASIRAFAFRGPGTVADALAQYKAGQLQPLL